MKLKYIFLLLSLSFFVGCDGNKDKDLQPVTKTELCKSIDSLANSIMSSRQAGVPMVEMITFVNEIKDQELRKVADSMVKEAFKVSRFEVIENRDKATLDFRNVMYQRCLN